MQHELNLEHFERKVTLPAVKLKNASIQQFVRAHKDLLNHLYK